MKKEISAEEMDAMLGELNLSAKNSEQTQLTMLNKLSSSKEVNEESVSKRISAKQRKASFEDYQNLFLRTPKITNRKTVFISENLRDQVDEIARKLGDRKMSVSGFIENLVTHHLELYSDDLEAWRRL